MKKETLIKKLIKLGASITIIGGLTLSSAGCIVDWSNLDLTANKKPNTRPNIKEDTVDVAPKIEIDPDMAKKVADDLKKMADFIRAGKDSQTTFDNSQNTTGSNYKDYFGYELPDTLNGELNSEENSPTLDTKYNAGGVLPDLGDLIPEETTTQNSNYWSTTSPVTTTSPYTTSPNTTASPNTTSPFITTSPYTTTSPTTQAPTTSTSGSSSATMDLTQAMNLIKKCITNKLSNYAFTNGVDSSAIPTVSDIVYIAPTNSTIQVGFIDNANGSFVKINFSSPKSSEVLADLNAFYASNQKSDIEKFANSCTSVIDYSSIKSGSLSIGTIVNGVSNSQVASTLNKNASSNFIVYFDSVSPTKKPNGSYEYTYYVLEASENTFVGPMEITSHTLTLKSKVSKAKLKDAIANELGGYSIETNLMP